MSEKEYTDEEIEELDGYLNDEWNHDIYEELCGEEYDDYKDLFEPLEFFRLLYFHIGFVKANKAKPLYVSRNLKKISLTDEQLAFFYFRLEMYFDDVKEIDKQLSVCCREISKLRNNLDIEDEEDEVEIPSRKGTFEEILEHLETLSTLREKIAYLIKEKIQYEQNHFLLDERTRPTLAEKCKLEITKLQEIARLEASANSSKPKQDEPNHNIKRHKDLTLDRATLLMNYLFTFAKVNCHNTKKAEVISFLTGYSENTVGDKLSALHSKADENFTAYEKDMKIIRKYFEKIGLSEIVELIDRDLDIEK